MPGGLTFDSTQSYVAFAAIKFVGYSASAFFFNKRFIAPDANPVVFGLTRTILGMSVGAVAGLIGLVEIELAMLFFMLALIPFRIGEWFLTLWLFYRKSENFRGRLADCVALAVVWSFILDVPAAIGFLATGGLWIC
jgi:hypothetical protein